MRNRAGNGAWNHDAAVSAPAGRSHGFYGLTRKQVRAGALRLARHTGWAEAEIMAMPVSRFIWWIEGLPKNEQ
ncbi:hypothetical protein C6Y53_18930 [Pukyongiella litopenaei]|uniref:Uncharacterized protein n=1 Tax=Pukyongiella litopenaei TaxID=2605946 RepID=A0A5C2H343_9RHOB|nr:hypothetical protein C6Y53_18930 [Pukyongiella litopenaei]